MSQAGLADSVTLSLQIVDVDGQPVPSARVTVRGELGSTDASGWVSFPDLEPGRAAAWVQADGFVSATAARSLDPEEGEEAVMKMTLLSRGAATSFAAEDGADLESGIVRVIIAPNSLVYPDGATVSGSVDATVVSIDPTVVPEEAYPAPLEGRRANGKDYGTLTSFGMTEVRVTQGGEEVQVAPGAAVKLVITIPEALAGELELGQEIPQWTVSSDGLWDETGTGTVSAAVGGTTTWTTPLGLINNGKNCDIWFPPR